MNFLVDGMLGKLARWLRMLGQDVEYSTKFSDDELLVKAKMENRILLTKDFELYQRAMSRQIETLYIQGDSESERLSELSKRFSIPLDVDMTISYCPRCNGKLHVVSKEQIKNEVDNNTYQFYSEFWKCLNCSHIYWQGGHWKQITITLNEAKKILKEKCVA